MLCQPNRYHTLSARRGLFECSRQQYCPRTRFYPRASSETKVSIPHPEDGSEWSVSVAVAGHSKIVTASLKKPLGFVLEEHNGQVRVAQVTPNGSAERAGVKPGDILRATTARAELSSGPSGIMGQLLLLRTDGESFATVSAAIRSNRCSQCAITLVLERPAGEQELAGS
mmetsp:Transcript_26751/g.58327  ORF Transcript_26751/g.58327 Transcript_26751/m.58327 type:complete len:170 (+) Transcript_26751:108-617(+)